MAPRAAWRCGARGPDGHEGVKKTGPGAFAENRAAPFPRPPGRDPGKMSSYDTPRSREGGAAKGKKRRFGARAGREDEGEPPHALQLSRREAMYAPLLRIEPRSPRIPSRRSV